MFTNIMGNSIDQFIIDKIQKMVDNEDMKNHNKEIIKKDIYDMMLDNPLLYDSIMTELKEFIKLYKNHLK